MRTTIPRNLTAPTDLAHGAIVDRITRRRGPGRGGLVVRLIFEQDAELADSVRAQALRAELKTATRQLRDLVQEMIRSLTAANHMQPERIPEAYLHFYRAALVRLDHVVLDEPGALETVQDLSTEVMGVHEAIFAMYFDPARRSGARGQTAPMALN